MKPEELVSMMEKARADSAAFKHFTIQSFR